MKTRGILTIDACHLKAVIDAADYIDNGDAALGDRKLRIMVTSLIHVAAKLAGELVADLDKPEG